MVDVFLLSMLLLVLVDQYQSWKPCTYVGGSHASHNFTVNGSTYRYSGRGGEFDVVELEVDYLLVSILESAT